MAIPLPPDPYKALGVEPTAPEGDIRKVYLKLVLKCHPDKIQDPTLRAQKTDEFHKIQEAWDLLSDKNKREDYDEKVKINARNATMRANALPPRQTRSQGYPSPNPAGYNVYEFQETANANIYTAEPKFDRDSRRRREPSPIRGYTQHSSKTRSYEDDIPSHYYDDEARKNSAAYSSRKPAGASMERERDRDRRKADDDRERERHEKDRKKKEYASSQKSRDREKRSRTEEKTSRKARVVDESPEEYDSRDRDERPRRKDRGGDDLFKEFEQMHITSKYNPGNKDKEDHAMQYMATARSKAKGVPVVPSAPSAINEEFRPRGMQRADTYSTYPVPQPSRSYFEEEDVVRRSSASRPSSRRPSADAASPRSSDPNNPHIIDTGIPPFARAKPPLQHHNSAPPIFMDRMPIRSQTVDEPSSRRSSGGGTVPSMPGRAQTFQSKGGYATSSPLKHSHRPSPAPYSDDSASSESDEEPYSSRSRPAPPVKRPSVQKVYKVETRGGQKFSTVVEEDSRPRNKGEPMFVRKR